jgi:hypothetical protein
MSTLTVVVPSTRSTPRGAILVGWLIDAALAYKAYRRARAEERRLRRLAADREAVFRMARDIQHVDPGMASDLYAAAIRDCKWG